MSVSLCVSSLSFFLIVQGSLTSVGGAWIGQARYQAYESTLLENALMAVPQHAHIFTFLHSHLRFSFILE